MGNTQHKNEDKQLNESMKHINNRVCFETFFEDSLHFSNLLVASCHQNLHQGVFISAQTLLEKEEDERTS